MGAPAFNGLATGKGQPQNNVNQSYGGDAMQGMGYQQQNADSSYNAPGGPGYMANPETNGSRGIAPYNPGMQQQPLGGGLPEINNPFGSNPAYNQPMESYAGTAPQNTGIVGSLAPGQNGGQQGMPGGKGGQGYTPSSLGVVTNPINSGQPIMGQPNQYMNTVQGGGKSGGGGSSQQIGGNGGKGGQPSASQNSSSGKH